MKSFLLLTGFLISCFTTSAQKQEVTYQYYDNYNDSLKVFQFGHKTIISKIFSKQGKLLQETQRGGDNEAKFREINYEYDTKGRMITKEWSSIGFVSRENAGNFKIKYEWTYNEVDSILTDSFSKYSFSLRKYNIEYARKNDYDNQNLLISTDYNGARNFGSNDFEQINNGKRIYTYDNKKQLIREAFFYPTSNDYSVYEYSYDQDGRRVQMVFSFFLSYSNKLSESYKKNFEYDARGNLVTTIEYERDVNVSPLFIPTTKQIFIYDNLKREISTSISQFLPQYNTFREFEKTTSAYDSEGHLLEKRKAHIIRGVEPFSFGKDSVIETQIYKYYPDKKLKERLMLVSYLGNIAGDRNRYEYQTSENATEIGFNDNYIVYPNPATDKITVINTLNDDCLESVALHDMSGKQMLLLERTDTPLCVWEIELPPTLQSGIYLLYCKSFNGKTTGKKIAILR